MRDVVITNIDKMLLIRGAYTVHAAKRVMVVAMRLKSGTVETERYESKQRLWKLLRDVARYGLQITQKKRSNYK